ncbi:MAG: MFS transporter [Alphaproteobacteria bacterium]|nr:MFS transporter [Alphaproteobacteria bacterium]
MKTTKWMSAGWAAGTVGSSTLLGAMSLLVLFYLTEYLGISPAVAGTLIFVSRLWDIGATLLIGQWSDRTQSRWGRRIPYLAVGAPVAALAYAMLFAAPESLSGVSLEFYVLVALLLYATGYTVFVVPYLTIPAEITALPNQRTTMMSYRVAFMTVAGLNIAVLGPMLINLFGGGRSGYVGMGVVQGLIILAFMWGSTAAVARAPVMPFQAQPRSSFFAPLKIAFRNKPFVIFIAVKFFQLFAGASTTTALLYLARYILDQDESFLIRFGVLQTIGTLVAIPVWAYLARRHGKRNTYMGAGFLYALIALSWLTTILGEASWITDARLFAVGFGAAGLMVVGFSILPDTMEHNTKTSGISQEGTLAALYSMVEKGTAALGPLIAGFLLEASGFISAAGGELPPEQPQSAIIAILLLVAVIPATCNVIGSLLLTQFDLKETKPSP